MGRLLETVDSAVAAQLCGFIYNLARVHKPIIFKVVTRL